MRVRSNAHEVITSIMLNAISHATVLGHRIPPELAPLLPYVLTLVVLVAYSGRTRKSPEALGKL